MRRAARKPKETKTLANPKAKKPKRRAPRKQHKVFKSYVKPTSDTLSVEGAEGTERPQEGECASCGGGQVKAKKEKDLNFVYPIRTSIKHKNFLVFDLESKKKDLDTKGFERPFLACVYDGDAYQSFRNDPKHKGRSYKEEFWHDPGGCVDAMMRHILGFRACEKCGIKEGEVKYGGCKKCLKARRKYTSKAWTIYAHNFGKFDGLYVYGWLRRHDHLFRMEIINVQSRMLILTVKLTREAPRRSKLDKFTFSDSIALIPLSLKEIGKTFFGKNPDVQKIGFDLDLPEDHADWDAYNERDCFVLHSALVRFRDLVENIGGSIGMTAASTAMQIFRRRFQVEKVPGSNLRTRPVVIHRNLHMPDCTGRCEKVDCAYDSCNVEHDETGASKGSCHGCMHDFVRDGFFGGRTEIYTTYGEWLFYYDLNSSYPASMLLDMPVGKAVAWNDGASITAMTRMHRTHIGFVECVVEIPEDCYLPPLPYRYVNPSGNRKLIFPAGTLYGTWSWDELLLLARVGGRILEVGKSVWYRRRKIFTDFVHKLYAYRKHKASCPAYRDSNAKCNDCGYDEGLSYVAKLIMNSLYGKWGMNALREMLFFMDGDMLSDPDFEVPLGIFPPPTEDGHAIPVRVQHAVEADYIVPQISAQITTQSRIKYWNGLYDALERTSKPLVMPSETVREKAKRLTEWARQKTAKRPLWDLAQPLRGRLRAAGVDASLIVVGGEIRVVDRQVLHYGDTDSCTATVTMRPEGPELGDWKREDTNIRMVAIQPKFYYFDRHDPGDENGVGRCRLVDCDGGCVADKKGKTNKVRMKGVPREDSEGNPLQTKEVFDFLRGADGRDRSVDVGWAINEKGEEVPTAARTIKDGRSEIHFERLEQVRGLVRHGLTSPVMEPVRRSLVSVYDKRDTAPDGTTMPLVVRDPRSLAEARKARRGLVEPVAA